MPTGSLDCMRSVLPRSSPMTRVAVTTPRQLVFRLTAVPLLQIATATASGPRVFRYFSHLSNGLSFGLSARNFRSLGQLTVLCFEVDYSPKISFFLVGITAVRGERETLTWQQIRERFEAGNTALQAAQLGVARGTRAGDHSFSPAESNRDSDTRSDHAVVAQSIPSAGFGVAACFHQLPARA